VRRYPTCDRDRAQWGSAAFGGKPRRLEQIPVDFTHSQRA
jgi:hypothetical protein